MAIFGPLHEIWVLIAHGLKFDLKTVCVLVERMCVGVGDSILYPMCFCEVFSMDLSPFSGVFHQESSFLTERVGK